MSEGPEYGPNNPHPLSQVKTELVWEGKYDEYGNRREVEVAGADLPLQKVESIDEPRSSAEGKGQMELFEKKSHRQDDFRNMLIWGDNKLVMASLLREFKGMIDLIYIDPPFDVGADFAMNVRLGKSKEIIGKEQSILEAVAYRDTWGRGADSYAHMIYERVVLMRSLLKDTGAIYVHIGQKVLDYIRGVMDEVFGRANCRNIITWQRMYAHNDPNRYGAISDHLLYYTKTDSRTWNVQYTEYSKQYLKMYNQLNEKGRRFKVENTLGPGNRGVLYDWHGHRRYWRYTKEKMQELHDAGLLYYTKSDFPKKKVYLDDMPGRPLQDIWTDINVVAGQANELTGYATQKPEALLERIIKASSNEGDLVADLFCGSGTTGAVAEKLGRRWIMADLGRFAIHTSRKRMIGIQRELYNEQKPYRAFDVYNMGRYERQWWQKERLQGADEEHRSIVLAFYRAEVLTGTSSPLLHGRKGPALVSVDGIDSILTLEELGPIVEATQAAGAKEVHCLAWEFEMDLKRNAEALEHEYGVKARLIRIPREVMEKNRRPGVDEVPFFEMATLAAEPLIRVEGGVRTVDVKLTNFLPSLSEVPSKELEALKERAIKHGFDFIDFWAVDFDHHDGQPFNHHWQDYRLRKDRTLKTVSDCKHTYEDTEAHTICAKVIDVFGCDTSVLLEVPGTRGARSRNAALDQRGTK